MVELSDKELLEALGVEIEVARPRALSARQERIISGFQEVQQFYKAKGRLPEREQHRDILERTYAVRLARLREIDECRDLLEPLDTDQLLSASRSRTSIPDELGDEELLAELGVLPDHHDDITQLRHVKPRASIVAAEEVAQRKRCDDFDKFRPLFEAVRLDLETGLREARRFGESAAIKRGEFFILGGQIAYIAEMPDDLTTTDHGHAQGRLRIIYDNGTEADNLLRSFQRALYKDDAGRRISEPSAGPLFGSERLDEDLASGTIYVLRSDSDHPVVAAHRELIHKIGVTGGEVGVRIANAIHDPTYLLSSVQVVAEYRLYNINRTRLEGLLHRVFGRARLDVMLPDRFGSSVQPREWYLVPLALIDEAVERIRNGSIVGCVYDPTRAALIDCEDGSEDVRIER